MIQTYSKYKTVYVNLLEKAIELIVRNNENIKKDLISVKFRTK